MSAWSPVPCQHSTCAEKSPAAKKCYDAVVAADCADTSPPVSASTKCGSESTRQVFLCRRCADDVVSEKKVTTLIL